jgi:acetate kinase
MLPMSAQNPNQGHGPKEVTVMADARKPRTKQTKEQRAARAQVVRQERAARYQKRASAVLARIDAAVNQVGILEIQQQKRFDAANDLLRVYEPLRAYLANAAGQ